MSSAYQEHVLHAADVCNSCLGVIRVERLDPTRDGMARDYEAHYERHKERTVVGYGPAESVSDQKGVWCECGVESARTRIWDDADVDEDRFRTLVQTLLRTLEHKDVTVDRHRTAAHALQARRWGADVDEALADGVDAGLAVATASSSGCPKAGD